MGTQQTLQSLRTGALRWYSRRGRDLPWRTTRDPYRIWISEVMLQQTQVSRVKDYYRRFLERFPAIEVLAGATWPQVLPLWRGLGYYARGRNVLAAAKAIVRDHGGKIPASEAALRALPGVGPYTANAVLSFAFDKPVPAFDTNMRRVIGRVFHGTKLSPERLAEELFALSPRNGAKLNHALMDIGATFCSASAPRCDECPLERICAFKKRGRPLAPRAAAKRRPAAVDVGAACIHRDGRFLLAKRTRANGGDWEFPGGKRLPGEDIRACIKREIREELGVEVAVRPAFLVTDFTKGGKLYRLHFCRCQILRGKPKVKEHQALRWVDKTKFRNFKLAATNLPAAAKL